MKQYLKEIYDEEIHDGFMFILDEKEQLDVSAFKYKDNAEAIEKHEIGFKYHVITYKETIDGDVVEPDIFEAIIGNPHHYIANLLKCGFFGTICKKTRTSSELANTMYNDLVNMVIEDDEYANA
jgi:hypothetical protein